MTSVASTSYYASLSYRANTAPSNRAPESVYDALYSNQQRETKPEAKVALTRQVPAFLSTPHPQRQQPIFKESYLEFRPSTSGARFLQAKA